jgi:GNAT superfamily N-acetyltransferase
MDVRAVPADAAAARLLMAEYLDEIAARMGPQFDRSQYLDAAPGELAPPAGMLLLGYEDDLPVACGAVRVIGAGIAEIKRMYVAPQARGRGRSCCAPSNARLVSWGATPCGSTRLRP